MQDSNFWSQAAASLIGALGAFLLSILLFYITQFSAARRRESTLAANAVSEVEVDISLLEEISGQIDELCGEIDIEQNKSKLYVPMRFSEGLSNFISAAYQEGILRNILSPSEITELNRLLNRSSKQSDDLNDFVLQRYKEGATDKAETLRYFRAQKKQVAKDAKFLKDVKDRLQKISNSRLVMIRSHKK